MLSKWSLDLNVLVLVYGVREGSGGIPDQVEHTVGTCCVPPPCWAAWGSQSSLNWGGEVASVRVWENPVGENLRELSREIQPGE